MRKRDLNTNDTYKWFDRSALVICWMAIMGIIVLITRGAWADSKDKGGRRSGFLPGARSFNNPYGNPIPKQTRSLAAATDSGDGSDSDDAAFDEDFPARHEGPPERRVGPSVGSSSRSSQSGNQDNQTRNNSGTSAPLRGATNSGSDSSGGRNSPTGRSVSVGGTPDNTPNPTRNSQGVSLGTPTTGTIVSKNPAPLMQIDPETGKIIKGGKELITDFNFPDADILDIAKTLGKLTGQSFIYDNKDVKGRVTIVSNVPIPVAAAWQAFLTALDINGFALIPSGNYLRIARQRDARDKQLKTYTGDFSPDTDALLTRVFQLKYISPEEVARTFRNFMPPNSRIIPYEQTNTVIVTDTGSNIAKLAKMLEILDVEGFDAGIEVVPVKFASAVELSKLIDTLIPGTSAGAGAGPPGATRFSPGGSRFSARRTKEGGIINTIIADERTNTLILHANTKGADQVRELVAKLDQRPPAQLGGGRVHVVYLSFADAEQIAATLNNITQQTANRPAQTAGGAGTGTNPIAESLFQGSIKISPDKATNSLVITASPSDFVTVQRVINRLDIPRDQVYVEVVIMEISLSRSFNFSANLISAPSMLGSVTKGSDVTNLLNGATTAFASEGAIINFKAGNSYNLTVGNQTVPVSSFMGFIRALQGNSSTNVLATPQILALDNTEAIFETSDKVPTTAGTTQGVGLTTQNIVKEPVVLSVKIKPQINKLSNFIKMDVTAKLGNTSPNGVPAELATKSFTTQDRTAQTSVVVGDSDTIVLGGLIRDNITDQVVKVPILGDIPLLGWLFKSKTTTADKRNLLVFLTPHIVRQYEKIRAILDRKLKERDEFMEANAGGDDPLRPVRDNIIRSLPDINELKKKPQTSFELDEDNKVVPTEPAAKEVTPNTRYSTAGSISTPPSTPSSTQPEGLAPISTPNDLAPPPATEPSNDINFSPAPTAPIPSEPEGGANMAPPPENIPPPGVQ